jgi:hypothetical protein
MLTSKEMFHIYVMEMSTDFMVAWWMNDKYPDMDGVDNWCMYVML